MAGRVNHQERKRDIARKATHLFSQAGYENVSLLEIARAAGVARTILYRYFKDKREVLDTAIRANTDGLLESCYAEMAQTGLSSFDRLRILTSRVVEAMFERHEFLVAVYDFVLSMARHGENMAPRIVKFTRRYRQLLRKLVAAGVKDGSIDPSTNKTQACALLFGLSELCASRIVLGVEKDAVSAKRRFADYLNRLTPRA